MTKSIPEMKSWRLMAIRTENGDPDLEKIIALARISLDHHLHFLL
jgi:hypothetical protein